MSDNTVNNPPYEVPPGMADAPPAVPKEGTPDPHTEEYLDGFAKSPDPRDPPTSEITPGDVTPAAPGAPPGEAPATAPPVNVDVPYVEQAGAQLTCTMGNWEGEPTSYAYQWRRDGVDVGDGTAVHALTEADAGVDFVCVVTAGNALGTTEAPPSNTVTAMEDAAGRDAGHHGRRKRKDPF